MPVRHKHYSAWKARLFMRLCPERRVAPEPPPLRTGNMTRHHVTAYGTAAALTIWIAASVTSPNCQSAASPQTRPDRAVATPATVTSAPQAARSSATPRALLDRYCVTCHNDRVKTANLSLQGLDLTKVAADAEVWEKVIRKMRAGVMPPPDLPRPPRAEYEGLRDWLEAEIDRVAAPRPQPGSVVLHRLNRTEYANAIRDLLDLRIDATTLLPPMPSPNGSANIPRSPSCR